MDQMSETAIDNPSEPRRRHFSKRRLVKYITIVVLAISIGYVHYRYVSHLFENDRNFSYLSELEREMSLQTEMGFYYSYYKTVVQEKPFMTAITKLMYDRLVEHPKEVNAFNRFNIHPEVLIGGIYRYFEPILNTTAHRQCHMIDRGEGLSPVESCVGLGQPILFYLEAVWVLAGLTAAALFLHAAALSETLLGGLFAVLQYFTNHAECTRVQWAPNERENMAAPLLLLQAWLVSLQLRGRGSNYGFQLQISIFIVNCLCLLFWQFSQFIFLTQTAIFFIMEQLKIIDLKSLCVLLHSHFCGLHMAVLLLQGNDMLKSSLYASFFIIISAYCLFFSSLRVKVENRLDLFVEIWLILLRISIVICASLYLKKVISDFLDVQEDSHIWDILYAKFADYKNFHVLLYICSDVFDFLPWSSVKKLTYSLLIPLAVLSIFNVCNHWLTNAINRKEESETEDRNKKLDKDGNNKKNYETEDKNNDLDKDSNDKKENNVSEKDSNSKTDDEDSGIENTETVRKRRKNDLDALDKDVKSHENIEKENDSLLCFLRNLTIEPAVFYNISQMVVYGVMAGLVMRLKLLFVPQMCVVSSLVFNKTYYRVSHSYMKHVPLFWIVCLIPVLHQLFQNVSQELTYIGEFSDIHKEHLLTWILRETSPGAVFAGSMPLLASVMLSTRRAVVAHPHYEHKQARERAYTVYKTYGRFSSEELYEELTKLRVTYLIVEEKYCHGKSSKGCSFEDIWDVEAPSLRGRPSLCRTLLRTRTDHYYPVYRNPHYAVFKLHDYSVRYMPRSFDT